MSMAATAIGRPAPNRLEGLDEKVRRAYRRYSAAKFNGRDKGRLSSLMERTVAAHNHWREEKRRSQRGVKH